MEFISSRELRINPGLVWEKLEKEKALVITSNGKPVGVLSGLPGGNVEAALTLLRRLKAQWALQEARKVSKAKGWDRATPADVLKAVQNVRKARRRAA